MDLRFSPVWPWWATIALGVGLAAFAVWTYPPGSPRRRTLLSLRLAAIFVAQQMGHHLSGWDQFLIVLTAIAASVGAAGIRVLHGYSGAVDRHGNELLVTEIAIADEVAAAADLVKGKLTAMPVASAFRQVARVGSGDEQRMGNWRSRGQADSRPISGRPTSLVAANSPRTTPRWPSCRWGEPCSG